MREPIEDDLQFPAGYPRYRAGAGPASAAADPEAAAPEELPNPYTRLTAVDATLQRLRYLHAEFVAHQGEPMARGCTSQPSSDGYQPADQLAAVLQELVNDLHGALMGPLPVVAAIATRHPSPWLHRWTERLWPLYDDDDDDQADEDQTAEAAGAASVHQHPVRTSGSVPEMDV
jgi:hypothetical protein